MRRDSPKRFRYRGIEQLAGQIGGMSTIVPTSRHAGAHSWRSRFRARLLAAFIVPCMALLSGWQVWSAHSEAIGDAELMALTLARVAEEHIVGVMRGVDNVLARIAFVDGDGDGDGATAALRAAISGMPEIRDAFITDASGRVVAGSQPNMRGIDIHDREYFVALAQDLGKAMSISPPLSSRVGPVVSVFAARPLSTPDGTFRGVAVVALDPLIFEEAIASVLPVHGGSAAVSRRDGTLLSRLPDPRRWLGGSIGLDELFKRLAVERTGVLRTRSVLDNVDTIAAYRGLEAYPLVVIVGTAVAPALAEWRRNSMLLGVASLVLAVFTFGLTHLSDRRLDQRRWAEIALRASEARFRLLSAKSPVGIFQTESSGVCLYANQRWLELMGLSADRALGGGCNWMEAVHPDDRLAVGEEWRQAVGEGREFSAEYRVATPSGGIKWLRGRAAAAEGDDGIAAGYVGTVEDVSQRHEAERRLRLSEQKFATAFRNSPDVVLISTIAEGRCVDVNEAFTRMLGYRRDEAVGLTGPGVWADEAERARIMELLQRDGHVANVETPLRRKNGDVFTCLISAERINWDDQDCLLIVGRDISRRKEMEDRMRALVTRLDTSNKELEQFAYVTSHDLQEPLRMIVSYAQLIDKRYRGQLDTDADDFLGFMIDGAKRMQAMIADLLEYSRVERKGCGFTRFEAGDAIEAAILNLSVAAKEAAASITCGAMPTVTADRGQFVRLMQNLIGNAIKYRHPDRPPEIAVDARRQNGDWVFSVSDNGIGIDPQYFDRIFLIFQRLHTRSHYEGTGIGLAVCKKIVERHGGHITVQSVPDVGSVFSFTLPVQKETA
jgi:PAS domain S-box-containing protein